jgi:hypothetical protein
MIFDMLDKLYVRGKKLKNNINIIVGYETLM